MRDGELLLPLIEEWDTELVSRDPLRFPGDAEALAAADGESIRTGLVDALVEPADPSRRFLLECKGVASHH